MRRWPRRRRPCRHASASPSRPSNASSAPATGLSIRETIQCLCDLGAEVLAAACIIDRSAGKTDVGVQLVVDHHLLRQPAGGDQPVEVGGDAVELVDSIRSQALLNGFRGKPPVNRMGVAEVMLALSGLADRHPDVLEVDLNPLVATPRGRLVALDARVRIRCP